MLHSSGFWPPRPAASASDCSGSDLKTPDPFKRCYSCDDYDAVSCHRLAASYENCIGIVVAVLGEVIELFQRRMLI